jgi:hypothetical protein
MAHFHLALAFEASGDRHAATRAYSTTRSLLQRHITTTTVETFGGYTLDDFIRLLDNKRGASR